MLGNFDGFHLGHQALAQVTLAQAARLSESPRAVFFDPHPNTYFGRTEAFPLTTVARRTQLLRDFGLEVEVVRFDAAFAQVSAADFVRDFVRGRWDARLVVVGEDFRFGSAREGDVALLRSLGSTFGFEVVTVTPVTYADEVVSSTRVRQCLASGDVDGAASLLGRPHDVDGQVVHGDARGRTIGFPTANLQVAQFLPMDGVYAVKVEHGEHSFDGVANLGVRPTFGAGRSLEVHLFDFDSDIYGEILRVAFVKRLRGELRFESKDALVAQIQLDCAQALELARRAER